MKNIENYFEYNHNLSAGAQPTAEQIAWLKENGVEAIVNISPVSTKNYLKEEAALIEQLDMAYVHFPIDCSNLKAHHYLTFKGILDGLKGKKTFVHCGGNIKTSNLIHMYHVLEKDVNEAESAHQLLQVQTPEEKWLNYFKRFGMEGLMPA